MITRATCCLLISLLILSINSATISATSSSSYEQPLCGFAWPTQEILVVVQKNPEYARQAVLKAMQNWNLAQTWFFTTYETSGRAYRFIETDQLGESYVKITFNQTQSGEDWGYANWYYWWDSNGVFYRITVSISLVLNLRNGQTLSPQQLQAVAAHELGHALGLDHTVFSQMDLMNHLSPNHVITVPSTLNLYAIALLSTVTSRNNIPQNAVVLPQSIKYETPSESAIPEMPLSSLTLIVAFGLAMALIKCRKGKCDSRYVSVASAKPM